MRLTQWLVWPTTAERAGYFRRAKEVHTDIHHADGTVRGTVAWITYCGALH